MARALDLAESISPCILFIDEMEKALAGGNGGESDGGTSTRMMNILLTWLSDKEKPVFVIGTANDITGLRPELTRAGRFDEIFFASVPSLNERVDILKIHLRKRGYRVLAEGETPTEANEFSIEQLTKVAEHMKDFTGAEIEQVVSNVGRKKYAAFRKGEAETHYASEEDLTQEAMKLVPLSDRNPYLLGELREWAKSSAKFASSEEEKLVRGDSNTDQPLYKNVIKPTISNESLFDI